MCVLRADDPENMPRHIVHLNDFSLACVIICRLRLYFLENCLSHVEHVNVFSLSWIPGCWLKTEASETPLSLSGYSFVVFPVLVIICPFSSDDLAYSWSHTECLYGFSLVWIAVGCSRLDSMSQVNIQRSQYESL